jgi:alpha-L-fucosidase
VDEREWKISGQTSAPVSNAKDAIFNESKRKALTAEDFRFTTKGQHVYAFVIGWPEKQATITPLGTASTYAPSKIENVELIGFPGTLQWTRSESGLRIQMPERRSSEHAIAFKISGGGLV